MKCIYLLLRLYSRLDQCLMSAFFVKLILTFALTAHLIEDAVRVIQDIIGEIIALGMTEIPAKIIALDKEVNYMPHISICVYCMQPFKSRKENICLSTVLY